jgi:hypothetical protein
VSLMPWINHCYAMTISLLSGESTLISSHCYIPLAVMLVIYRRAVCRSDWLVCWWSIYLKRYITSSTSSQGISVRLDWAPRAFSSVSRLWLHEAIEREWVPMVTMYLPSSVRSLRSYPSHTQAGFERTSFSLRELQNPARSRS